MKVANLFVNGVITAQPQEGLYTTLAMLQEAYAIQQEADEITVYINSNGGDVTQGFAIHDWLKSLGKPITTIVNGLCASIATVIALSGDKRKISPNSEYYIHNPWGGIEGDHKTVEKYAAELKVAEEKLVNFYASNTIASVDVLRSAMDAETNYTPQQAFQLGFVTEEPTGYKIAALYTPETINPDKTMSTPKQGLLKSILAKAQAILDGGEPKAMQVETENGTINIHSDGEPKVGDLVTTEGETPAANGTYTLTDGSTIEVMDGAITAVTAKAEASEDVETLKAQLQAAKEENETLKAENAEAAQTLIAINAKFESGEVIMGRKGGTVKALFSPKTSAEPKSIIQEANDKRAAIQKKDLPFNTKK